MIIIDGATGEGGGQIFRTALTLSMALGKPVRILNIRAGRKKPGLLRQHLACLKAARAISSAEVTGDVIGSQDVTFVPGKVKAGSFHFSVGSAGSTTLIFQTIFPVLALQDEVSEVTLEGGTHNGMAPSFDFLHACFLPAVEKLGFTFASQIESYGFYPAGGGRWTTRIYPRKQARPLLLLQRGQLQGCEALVTQAKIPFSVADRELEVLRRALHIDDANLHRRNVNSVGPGNIVSLQLQYSDHVEVMEAIGERGVRAEQVAKKLVMQVQNYQASEAPVGEFLADQLIVPMALTEGGCFCASPLSSHFNTNVAVVEKFLDVNVEINHNAHNALVTIKPLTKTHWTTH
ncbi:RNA 3'-terminal phosphate cyclase [Thalassocella blandensis]|nr:RNA 3'-terminal phosphate cyclase [Thalassocella blandensis]